MEKTLSIVLALVMVLSLSVTAFADTNDGTAGTNITVSGTYQAGTAAADVISADITWDAMTFTYTGASSGTWNPATHSYEGVVAGGWSTDTKTITVKNHSNVGITAKLRFVPSVSGVVGTFTESSGTANDNVLELATAMGTSAGTPPTASAQFGISGGAISKSDTIGTITVTIAKSDTDNEEGIASDPAVLVSTASALQGAVSAGGTVKLGSAIDMGTTPLSVNCSTPVTIDLGGYTLTASGASAITVSAGSVCTIQNGTVKNTASEKPVVENNGTVTIRQCELYANNYCALDNRNGATVTDSNLIDNMEGEAIYNSKSLTLSGAVNLTANVIRSESAYATVMIRSGTYNFDPSSYVDTGAYTVTKISDNTWTVTAK